MSSGGERGRRLGVLSEGRAWRSRTHLEATGLVTAGGFPVQVSQPGPPLVQGPRRTSPDTNHSSTTERRVVVMGHDASGL